MAGRWVAHRGSAELLGAPPQTYPAAAPGTARTFVNKLNPSSLKGGHDLGQTFYHTADSTVACFHTLNGRK